MWNSDASAAGFDVGSLLFNKTDISFNCIYNVSHTESMCR